MGTGASKNVGQAVAIAQSLADGEPQEKIKMDSRLPYTDFRELFTLKNYWKTVRRNDVACGKTMLYKYLKTCPEAKERYQKLNGLNIDSPECSEPAFETIASNYLKVFDEVITAVEQTPSDASSACQRLSSVGKMHRSKVNGIKFDDFQQLEAPFLYMISEILQDRFNEKAEMLFRKFFQFCLRFILEGFNS
uniref:Globin family profile domain-containing protein n=1 Tax=Globodera rostochiensis TaxID=31243 RepID=A0A914HD98_GLORO